jgi:phosphatidylethanolamine-binding protein (PEBP) family uncharacterized protein
VAILGPLLKKKRAGEANLAWHRPALAGPETLALSSPDHGHEASIPKLHVGRHIGGSNTSPALVWSGVPAGTAQLLLIFEDADSPTRSPFVHCVALLEPDVTELPQGGLHKESAAPGVQLLRSTIGRGYRGP